MLLFLVVIRCIKGKGTGTGDADIGDKVFIHSYVTRLEWCYYSENRL